MPPDETLTLVVERTKRPLARTTKVARTFWTRAKGLLGRSGLPPGEALMFPGCHAVHTMGMRFPIDLVFVDKDWRVVALQPMVRPGRFMVGPVRGAWGVVEMASGTVAENGLEVGDQLQPFPNGYKG
jgi:uncharacterized membrane protein (UPF0127 family)